MINRIFTVVLALFLLWICYPLFEWAFIDAVWRPDAAACRAAQGACWGFIAEKHRLILFGTYPYSEQWRPVAATLLLIALLTLTTRRSFGRAWLGIVWAAGLAAIFVLMGGGMLGLSEVETARWGGLPLTLILAVGGLAIAFPLAIVLALGRRSQLPVIRAMCIAYIELVRGVPLISVLFMASVMVPLFLPPGISVDKLVRAEIGIILFAAAYVAESIRGGLQAVPSGQEEAADALGLPYAQKMGRIVLPQALKIAIPSITNNFISTFKDTSLVVIIGLFDLLGALKAALNDAPWRTFFIEGYLFVAVIYFALNMALSTYAQSLERETERGPTVDR